MAKTISKISIYWYEPFKRRRYIMKKSGALRMILLILLFSFIIVNADVWYVEPGTFIDHIQEGIDMCEEGDTVLVAKGTYVENINFKGMGITVMSEFGADSTIIDGSSPSNSDSGSVVTIVGSGAKKSVLDGFTITGGTGVLWTTDAYSGGGIYCYQSSPKIINNIIYGNSPYTSGGGIACWMYSHPVISNNIIKENSTYYGGGIEIADNSSTPKVTNNTISENTAYDNGGGINIVSNATPIIKNNKITDNTSPHGAGIFCGWGVSPTIDSCEISDNNGDGIYCRDNSTPVIHYNDIVDNQGYGVRNTDGTVTVDARYNWWGDSTGPYHPVSNPGGLGDTVSNYVDFDLWLDTAGIEEEESDIEFLYISGCYPNPFMDRTRIEYSLPVVSNVNIAVYNLFGARVKSLLNKRQNAGRYTITWSGRDDRDNKLPGGLYFLRLEAGVDNETRKLLLVR
jgi:parallel beta-helix repeat protein